MTKEPIMIDENICDYYSDTKEDEEGANPVVDWCFDNNCKCEDIPFDECVVKAVQYCKLKDKQLKRKVQKCNQLKAENKKLKELVKTRIEDLCDSCGASSMMPMPCKVYEQALLDIKKIAEDDCKTCTVKLLGEDKINCKRCYKTKILQKCEVKE